MNAFRRTLLPLVFAAAAAFPGDAWAQSGSEAPASAPTPAPDVEATHNELRALRDGIMEAWQRRDLDAMLAYADPEVVVTWQNGEVSRGPAAIKQFYQSMFEDNGGLISDMKSEIKVDDLAILHGADIAVAYGSIHDVITFRKSLTTAFIGAGDSLALDSRWSATLMRKNGAWKLVSYHVSANLFSNPVMTLAVNSTQRVAGIGGLVVGMLVVFAGVWIRRMMRKAPAAA